MIPELAEIRDAMDTTTGGGRDLSTARRLAKAYVSHRADRWADATIDECVREIDRFHATGDAEGAWRVQAYLLANFEPQQITGTYNVVTPPSGMAGA